MIRRRRLKREIPFSFDSFLDVVANVVGIILRLILVAWVGARTCPPKFIPAVLVPPVQHVSLPEPTPAAEPPKDPLEDEIARLRADLRDAEARLQAEKARAIKASQAARFTDAESKTMADRRRVVENKIEALAQEAKSKSKDALAVAQSAEELRTRTLRLRAEIEKLKRTQDKEKRTLHYRNPVSQPVQEEIMFELRHGRVTLVDLGALLAQMKRDSPKKMERLRTAWEFTGITSPVGAFRLRYTIERERKLLEGAGRPNANDSFHVGLARAEVEPIVEDRGESAPAALGKDSAFRKLVDDIDVRDTAITFWVYPDSFALYRELRNYLHDRDVVVAGRPLPEGARIEVSPKGTTSRGQ
jgi:hypothetical protein